MQKNPIGWIELPALDLDRAEKFYADYFGYTFERQEADENGMIMSWFMPMDMDSYGSGLTLLKGNGYEPDDKGILLYFSAPGGTVAVGLAKAKEQGIAIIQGLTKIRDNHGYYAILKDSEGNRFAIHSMKPE